MSSKTLKDLKKYDGSHSCDKRDVKAEAIKWVKKDLEDINKTLTGYRKETALVLLNKWMERLNIIEGDLK